MDISNSLEYITTPFLLKEYTSYGCKDEHLNEAIHIISVEFMNGIGIILLTLISFLRPFHLSNSSWVFPAQEPSGVYDERIIGVNWADMLLPLLMCSMGISISMHYRRSPGLLNYIALVFRKGISFIILALFMGNFVLELDEHNYSSVDLGMMVVAFFFIFLTLIEIPGEKWKITIFLRLVAFASLIVLSAAYHHPKIRFFSLYNSDQLLSLIGASWIFCSLWYIISSNNIIFRLVPLGFVLAMDFSQSSDWWTGFAWNEFPIPHLFVLSHLRYVIVVLPATVVGDFFLENIDLIQNASKPPVGLYEDYRKSCLAVAGLICLIEITSLIGLHPSILSPKSVLFFAAAIFLLTAFVRQFIRYVEGKSGECLLVFRKSIYWGVYFILIGWILIPSSNGIQANPIHLSYLFYASGFSMLFFVISFFFVVIFVFSLRKGVLQRLSKLFVQLHMLCGYNSMLMYATAGWLLPPLLHLVHLNRTVAGYVIVGELLLLLMISTISWFKFRWLSNYTIKENIFVLQYSTSPFEKMVEKFLNRE